jgi:hypothetical protein
MRMNIHRSGLAAAACAAVSAAALLTLGSGGAGGTEAAPLPDPAASLALLRQAPTSADRVTPVERQSLADIAAQRGLDLAGSRVASQVRLIPGDGADTVCVSLPDPVEGSAVACAPTASVEHGRLWTGLVGMPGQDVGDARVAIVVPDGVPQIETIDGSGVRTTQVAHDNLVVANLQDVAAYELTVDGTLVHVRLAGTPEELVDP